MKIGTVIGVTNSIDTAAYIGGGIVLSGKLYQYKSSGDTVMDGCTVELKTTSDVLVDSDTTAADGSFSLEASSAGTYRVYVTLAGGWSGVVGKDAVNATDAGLISGWATSPSSIEKVLWLTGDIVTPFGSITTGDAAGAMGYSAGSIPVGSLPYGEFVYYWKGETTSSTTESGLSPMTIALSVNTSKDIYLLAAGDFNRSGFSKP